MLAAVLTWLGWLTLCPALGFPVLGTAALVNRVLFFRNIPEAGHDPDFWVGWVIVVAGLVVAAAMFFIVRAYVVGTGISAGVIYGVALWLVAGLVIMPLIGLTEPSPSVQASGPAFQPVDPMQPTVMMYSLGPFAAVAALIAWVLFGAILGATERARQ